MHTRKPAGMPKRMEGLGKDTVTHELRTILAGAYDQYGAVLYGIALKIAPTKKQAEEVLISTFRKAYEQNIAGQKYPLLHIALIKLLVQTAYEQLQPKRAFPLKAFEHLPLLYKLLCMHITLEHYRLGNKLSAQVQASR